MAIYDCFQYFNEDHIVELRFNILDKYVDYFVISESTKNHQVKIKKLISKLRIFQNLKIKLDFLRLNTKIKLIFKIIKVESQ